MSQAYDLPPAPDVSTPAETIEMLEQTHANAQALLQAEVVMLGVQLARRFEEIVTLTQLLDAREAMQTQRRQLERQLTRARRVPRAGWVGRLVSRHSLPLLLRQQLVLRRSPHFDAEWYTRNVPDLEGMDPGVHYLRTGAYDCVDPGPNFSTIGYYLANPDVIDAGWPALVHYELYGRDQGRPLGL
jgi:hypothetical protein